MTDATRVVEFANAQVRATEVSATKGVFTNVVINSVLAEAATQTLDQVTANGATTTRAISITNARPGLTQTDAALTISGGLGVNANVVATNLISRVDGSVSDNESVAHKHGLQLFAPGGSSANASLTAGYDPTADVGYVNAGRSGTVRPLCLQTHGGSGRVGVGTSNPEVPFNVIGNNALSGGLANAIASFRAATSAGVNDAGVVIGSINGNSPYISDSGSVSLGLSFYTQNVKRLQIDSSGNVGIGTTNPQNKLDVRSDNHATFGKASPTTAGWSGIRLGTPYTTNHDAYCSVIESYNDHGSDYNSILRFKTSVGNNAAATERMRITASGKVGIGSSGPEELLTVSHSTTNGSAIRIRNKKTDASTYYHTTLRQKGYSTTDRALQFESSPYSTTTSVFQWLAWNSAGTAWDSPLTLTNTGNLTIAGTYSPSDDRLKTNETLIENATETLLKLRPQKYDKHSFSFIELMPEEYSKAVDGNVFIESANTWVSASEFTYSETEDIWYKRTLSDTTREEAGLIAQDIFYDAPELRYIVTIPDDANVSETRPEPDSNVQVDPDYSDWGRKAASVGYVNLVPYLIKSVQELDARVRELENRI